MELNTSQPQHSQIISKPSRNPILLVVIGLILIALVALGLLVWQKNQEIGNTLNQLADVERQLSDSLSSGKETASQLPAEQTATYTLSESEQKEQAVLGASSYYCAVANFGCDKVTTSVTEFQKATETTAGYAKVVATNDSGKKLTLWLVNGVGASSWIVFYEGAALPSPAVQEKFPVPTDFLAVD
jgi:hypothetical protein